MKGRNLLWIFPVICWNITLISAQEIVWAKNKAGNVQNYPTKGYVADNQGNFYEYGSSALYSGAVEGSFLSKFDKAGNFLFTKYYSNVALEDLKFDNSNRLFFTGFFDGTFVNNAISVPSTGGKDVILGEINTQGDILSVKAFGGHKDDFSHGLAIDNSAGKIIITGELTDSVYLNNAWVARTKQSMFVASYSKSLVFNNIQYFDFVAELNDPYIRNIGREIVAGSSGNLYVLHDREGDHPLSDPPYAHPLSGRYLMKINPAGTVLWFRRIIGDESYYGWDAGSLRVNNSGDAFLLKNSSGKYGGQGTLIRLNGSTGAEAWSYTKDTESSNYRDILIDNTNSLVFIGQEDEIPINEDSRYGYDMLKKFDQNNNVVWEKRLYDVRTPFLTLDHEQNLYLSGEFFKNTKLGKDSLIGVSDIGGQFIAKVINSGVSPGITTGTIAGSPFNPGTSINVPYTVSSSFNSGNIFAAQLSDPFGSFKYAVNIGSLTSTSSGTINAVIPATAAPGSAYRIRVIGSNPVRYGSDNGIDLTVLGGNQAFIAANASWKYLDNGTNQGTAWRGTSFSDAGWKTGNAELGYGDGGEATVVSYGPSSTNKYITTYFRKIVNISNPSQYSKFELSLLRDDGAVVYVNGVEVIRSNMPTGIISNTTKASVGIDGSAESAYTLYNIPSSRFINGNNLIAVEVHQSSVSSSDISFNLKLTGVRSAPSNELIAANSSWKYLDTGADLSIFGGWTLNYYSDSDWKTGNAELGYGDGDEATVVSYGPSSTNKYITTYFRKKFNADASEIEALKLELIRDDGVVVYLNGHEVYSNNMPAEYNGASALASSNIAGTEEKTWLSTLIDPGDLLNGENIIGVEIHQSSASSGDISFNLKLTPAKKTSSPPPPTNVDLILANASWKYLDNGTNQGTAWRGTSFNDTGWKTGNAELGYGDGGEATVVGYGPSSSNKYITTYFRRSFNVTDAGAFTGLELSLIRDDGAVVYLNGAEVFRANMPAGTIGYTTLAGSDGWGENTYQVANISKSALLTGNNVIAVEVHQNSPSSSDMSFNLKLKGLTGTGRIAENIEEKPGENVEHSKADFSIYPNPTSGRFTFEFCLDEVKGEYINIELINNIGQTVYKKQPIKINGCIREMIELERDLPSGIYIMNVITDKERESRKVVLNK